MRPLPRVLLFVGLATALALSRLHADPRPPRLEFGEAKWPSHPMQLFAKYRGGRALVVAAEKNQPVILVDGKRKTLSDSTSLLTQLAEDLSPAQVDFTGNIGIGNRKWVQAPGGGEATEWRDYTGSITLTAKTEVPDCYVLISFFDGDSMDDPTTANFFRTELVEVGTLHAGETRNVSLAWGLMMPLHFSNGDPSRKASAFGLSLVYWQLYSKGVEVRTLDLADLELRHTKDVYSGSGKTSTLHVTGVGTFIYLRERLDHEDAVEVWLKENRKTTKPARPYAQTPLQPWSSVPLPTGAVATLGIGKDGKVKEVAFEPALPADITKNLGRCLQLWLYLPEIKNGSAVPAKIRVPLSS